MNNIKTVFVVIIGFIIGFFVFKTDDKKPKREISSIKEKPLKVKSKALPQVKVIPPPTTNMALLRKTVESIPEAQLKEGEFPIHKGRLVARIDKGKLVPPDKGSLKQLLFSKRPTHPEIAEKAKNFFKAMGFDKDNQMTVERGKSYFLISGKDALKVESFKVSYKWNGKDKKGIYLIKSISGKYFKKLSEL